MPAPKKPNPLPRDSITTGAMPYNFQPTRPGTNVVFQNEGPGMITDETPTEVYIESKFFAGWMTKADFWEALGIVE